MNRDLTIERLREVLHYDPETGIFVWKVERGKAYIGMQAGVLKEGKYLFITIDSIQYRAHHLAWLWMTGGWPPRAIDHRDTVKSNNRWQNLRLATKSQNMANRPAQVNSQSGLKGAYYYPANKRWQSTIQKDGRTIYLGYFDTAEQAHAAYCRAAQGLYGEFARDG